MMDKANRMTRTERTELLSLVRKREKVLKTLAAERSAEMLAEFEAQAAKVYSFNDDAVWEKAKADVDAAVQTARLAINERCAAGFKWRLSLWSFNRVIHAREYDE